VSFFNQIKRNGVLELPVPFVLAALWVVGAVLEGALLAALYWSGLLLVQLVGDIL
jgi:hypothetical protein